VATDKQVPTEDLYGELEVDPRARVETIEAAYRSLMKLHHPDLAGPEGLARTKRLNRAREWLTDPERRARYDATRGARPAELRGPTTTASAPAGRPAFRGSATRSGTGRTQPVARTAAAPGRPSSTTDQAHRPGTTTPVGSGLRLGVLGVGMLVVALLVVVGASLGMGGAGHASAGPAGAAGSAPSGSATAAPTPSPSPSPTASPTASPTPAPSPAPSSSPVPASSHAPTGHADLRFSGLYAEHYIQALDGTSTCTATGDAAAGATSGATTSGFHLESNARSHARWQLDLTDLTVSWSMTMFFKDTADGARWNSGAEPGSVTRTSTGFVVDVVMTDGTHPLRVQGTVICR